MPGNFIRIGDFGENDEVVLLYTGIRRSMIAAGGIQIAMSLVELSIAIISEFRNPENYLEGAGPPAGHVFGYVTVVTMLLTGCIGVAFGLLCRMITSIQMIPPQIKRGKVLARVYMCFLAAVFIVAGVTIGLELFAMVSFRTLKTGVDGVPMHFPFSSAMIIVFGCTNILLGIVPLCGFYVNLASLTHEEKSLTK